MQSWQEPRLHKKYKRNRELSIAIRHPLRTPKRDQPLIKMFTTIRLLHRIDREQEWGQVSKTLKCMRMVRSQTSPSSFQIQQISLVIVQETRTIHSCKRSTLYQLAVWIVISSLNNSLLTERISNSRVSITSYRKLLRPPFIVRMEEYLVSSSISTMGVISVVIVARTKNASPIV
jgi:hypothetical protein